MQIQKVEAIQSNNDRFKQKKNNKILNIIEDDKIEIIGEKKPMILKMNKESNVELIKEEHEPIIEIQKVQSLEQPRNRQKRIKNNIFNISKNRDNNVDIIHEEERETEPVFEMQKVQNFEQPRDRKRKIKYKKNIKFKITKLKDEGEGAIPKKVGFLEMFGLGKIEQFNSKSKFSCLISFFSCIG